MRKLRQEKENRQLKTIQGLQQNYDQDSIYSHPNYQRIKTQVKNLIFQAPQNFKVSVFEQTKVRIVLRIYYFVRSSHINQQSNIQEKPIKKYQQSFYEPDYVQNFFIQQSDESVNQDEQKSFEANYSHNYILFTCIIDFDVYPFSPPYMVITESVYQFMKFKIGVTYDLQLNDFSNITDGILNSNNWFPSYTLEDILKYVPDFVESLKQTDFAINSTYYYQIPFRKLDINQHSLGLKIYQAEFYNTKDAFIGKYIKKILGFSFKSFIIFKHDQMNRLKITQVFSLHQLDDFLTNENEQRIKFTLIFKDKKQIIFKVIKSDIKKKSPEQTKNREYFLIWTKICLLNAIYKNLKKKEQEQGSISTNKLQKIKNKSQKTGNQQNQNSLCDISKDVSQKDTSLERKKMQYRIITKQEQLSKILETVDQMLSSRIYQMQKNFDAQVQQICVETSYTKEGMLENSSVRMYRKQKTLTQSIDLVRNEFLKLKHYQQKTLHQLKQLFIML